MPQKIIFGNEAWWQRKIGKENVATDFGRSGFDVPNAFVPNRFGGNGGYYDLNNPTNEVFYPISEFVQNYRLIVYNRWGEMVFESTDINIGWDGYYRGQLSPQDVYVWKVDITYVDGFQMSEAGDLTLLH